MGFFDDALGFIGDIFSGVLSWLMPDVEQQGAQGVTIERQGSDNSIPVVYGTQKVGAIKVHKYVTDTPNEAWNDLLHIIAVFAEGECDSIQELFFNDVSENDPKYNGGRLAGGKWVEIHRYNGAAGQPASAAAVSGIPNWTIDHRLDGLCYAYIVLQMPSEEVVWQGEPSITGVIRGKKVLDTRTGVTAYSENNAMCLRDYLTNRIYGWGMDAGRPNAASFERVADLCDVSVSNTVTKTEYQVDRSEPGNPEYIPTTVVSTVTKPRFTCNLVLNTEDNPFDNVKKILSSFRGILTPSAGQMRLFCETTIVETYGAGTTLDDLFLLDDSNIDKDQPINWDSGTINDRANRVEIRFPNKTKNYEMDSVFFPEESDPLYATWLNEDNGEELAISKEFPGITSKDEALQMARIVAFKSRFTSTVKLTSEAIGQIVEVGDIVALNNATTGSVKKPFRVVDKDDRIDDNVDFILTEHEDNIYPWSGATYEDLQGGSWLGDPFDIAPPEGLQLTPDLTLATTGTFTWNPSVNAFVRKYGVLVEKTADAAGDPIDPPQRMFAEEVIAASWQVPLLDVGTYLLQVRTIATTGAASGYAALAALLTTPVAPTSILLTPSDWQIEIRPQLTGIGLGTQFEFDIVQGDGSGYTPSSKARASAFTATGLLPDTLYTVYVRTVNAYGVSAWVSEQATTTVTGEQIDDFIDPIRQRLDEVELIIDDFDVQEFNRPIMDWVNDIVPDIVEPFQRREDINTESQQRYQQFFELNAEIEGVSEATLIRFDEVSADIAGNSFAITGLQLTAQNLQQQTTANLQQIQAVSATADGAAGAVSVLEGQVNDPQNNTSAMFQAVQQAQTTADGNADSITALLSGVTGETGSAQALLALQSYLNEGGLGARASLITDVNNRITGVIINDDGVERVIEFVSDSVRFVDGSGNLKVYFDNTANEYFFNGRIFANNSTFSGTVSASTINGGTVNGTTVNGSVFRGGRIELIGTNSMTVMSATPFGPNNLLEWKGPTSGNVSGGAAILNNLTKVNGIYWRDSNNNQYTSGTIIAGTLSTSLATSQITNTPQVETGLFGSNGGQIAINCSYSGAKSVLASGTCPSPAPANPSVTIRLYQLAPGSETLVNQQTFNGQYTCSQEGSEYIQEWSIFGTFTYYDNIGTTQDRNYRVEATVNNLPLTGTQTRRLSILTQEA